jgi:diguanylate cyclase (GGDEF)-like protein
MSGTGTRIDEALQGLRALIFETVKEEQQRDQLTGLPNDAALIEFLSSAVDQKRQFWIAFVEVDLFKRVNNAFGQEMADGLLQAIGRQLATGVDFFASRARPFRAHGDEFFIAGVLDKNDDKSLENISNALDQIRLSMSALRIAVAGTSKPMQCTVSIGWVTSNDGQKSDLGLTASTVRVLLERAVAEAKRRGRNKVIRYDQKMTSIAIVDFRGSCPECQASFTADVPYDKAKKEQIFCPNCGARQERPPPPEAPPVATEVEE